VTAPNIGVNLHCDSNCFQWCPRRLKIHCCCCHAQGSDSEEMRDSAEKADDVAIAALQADAEAREEDKKKSCCIIL